MKFTITELMGVGGTQTTKFKYDDLSLEIKKNVDSMLVKLNWLGKSYAPAVTATSFLRSIEDQKRINPAAMSSNHLYGRAIDLSDPKGELKKWIKENMDKVIEVGFWMEDFDSTPTWVHLQDVMPGLGNRIFKP